MKKLILAAFVLMAVSVSSFAQDEGEAPAPQKGFDKSKLFVGGNFGMGFGNVYTLINVSPQIGYRFNRFFAAGTGVNFIYTSTKYRYISGDDYKENYGVAGLNVFGRVYPIQYILFQIQPELNYTWGKLKFNDDQPDVKLDSKFVPSLLGGAGAAIPAGRGSFLIMVQYDLLNNERSPYGNRAFYNFGYNFGF